MVSDVFISDAKVYFSITVPAERAQELEPLRAAAERVVKEMPGVQGRHGGADRRKEGRRGIRAGQRRRPASRRRPMQPSQRPLRMPRRTRTARRAAQARRSRHRRHHRGRLRQGRRRQVDHRGQSRARPEANGLRVGMLDADIYGPSMPRLLKISGRPQTDRRQRS